MASSSPTTENGRVIAGMYEAFGRGDVGAVLAQMAPALEWIEAGDDVVVTGQVLARTRTGRDLDAPYAHVFSFRDGKVSRNDNFHDTALWVQALA
jgi:ketosteroid isomerase-like protein